MQELLISYPLNSVLSITREIEQNLLILHLRGEPIKIVAESAIATREIANILEQAREGDEMVGVSCDCYSVSCDCY